jgi:hypothetical protein
MKNVDIVKGHYSLMQLKKIQQRYIGMGNIGIFTRIMPYIILLAGIAGIVIFLIYLSGDRNTWDIFNLNMVIPVIVGILAAFVINHNKTIKAIRTILSDTTESMTAQGYSGNAGMGLGYYLMIVGCILGLVGAVCFFALDKE